MAGERNLKHAKILVEGWKRVGGWLMRSGNAAEMNVGQ